MDQQQTLELWQRCEQARADALAKGKNYDEAHEAAKAIWNGWANDLQDRREQLEQAGEWDSETSVVFSTSENPYHFHKKANFSEFIFPNNAGFENAIFKDEARFENTRFENRAWFWNTRFKGGLWCESTNFMSGAQFLSATFECDVWFGRTRFKGGAGFNKTTFEENTGFFDTRFKNFAKFEDATFSGSTTFSKAKFYSEVKFTAIKSERAFTLEDTTFEHLPNFIQANFTEAPRLDNADFISPFIQPQGLCASTSDTVKWLFAGKRKSKKIDPPDPDLPARYRALKRLAVQGHDTDRVLEFNAGEIKSRRKAEGFRFRYSAGRYCFAWLYEIFSDFGRSVARPFCCWFAIALLFTGLYASPWSGRENFPLLSSHFSQAVSQTLTWAEACKKVPNRNLKKSKLVTLDTNALWEALVHSFRNATLILSVVQPAAEWRTLGCLYGNSKDSPLQRAIPPAASFFGALQRLLSAIFIFLFGLALRNMLKMK